MLERFFGVVLMVLIPFCQCAFHELKGIPNPTAQAIREFIVDEINGLRQYVQPGPSTNMNYVVWNTELENSSMIRAETCPDLDSSMSDGENIHWFGSWPLTEDEYAYRGDYVNPEEYIRDAVRGWWDSGREYEWETGRTFYDNWPDVVPYIIMAGHNLSSIGCGIVDCTSEGKQSVMVCQFRTMSKTDDLGEFVKRQDLLPDGRPRLYECPNWEFGGSEQDRCTNCRSGTGWCLDGLCVDQCPAGSPSFSFYREPFECHCALEGRCENGVLNEESCKCECDGDHTGHKCDRWCMNFDNCEGADCSDPMIANTKCPAACQKCNCQDHGECVHGVMDTSPDVCKCVCTDGWSGAYCDAVDVVPCDDVDRWRCLTGGSHYENGDPCIPSHWRCDGQNDCYDQSDESPGICNPEGTAKR